ncbi:MAG: copper resistance CopC family protein [Methylococcaceae bacterium]
MMNTLPLHTNSTISPMIIRLSLLLIWLGFSGSVLAHAVVTESSLAKEPIKAHKPTTVLLTFNSNVEIALSRVFLVSKGDVYQPAQILKGTRPGEIRIPVPALEPGDYALKYKVFAADGHLTESVIRFSVGGK